MFPGLGGADSGRIITDPDHWDATYPTDIKAIEAKAVEAGGVARLLSVAERTRQRFRWRHVSHELLCFPCFALG